MASSRIATLQGAEMLTAAAEHGGPVEFAAVRTAGEPRSACRGGVDEVGYRLAQGCRFATIGQHDRLGKTQGPGHDATPQQNRYSRPSGGDFVPAAASRMAIK